MGDNVTYLQHMLQPVSTKSKFTPNPSNINTQGCLLQGVFIADDVSSIVKECLDDTLSSKEYNPDMVSMWTDECLQNCIRRLTALQKPFKYIVTCLILQKTGAGLHTAASCYWDSSTDGSRTVRWESKTMYCISTVFGLAM